MLQIPSVYGTINLGMRIPILSTLWVLFAAVAPIHSQTGEESPAPGALPKLDQRAIVLEYQEGNFDALIRALEGFQSEHKNFAASDSFFIARYFGVVYSVNPTTRERGKYYFYRMLELNPTADLLDLFVSESIDAIFQRVKKEFLVQRRYRGINDMGLAETVERQRRDTLVVRDTLILMRHDSSAAPLPKAAPVGFTGNLNGLMGLKLMDKEDWPLIHKQTAMKVMLDFRQASWPIHVAVDFLYSSSKKAFLQDVDGELTSDFYEGRTYEINGGIRKILDPFESVRPYAGVGVSYAMARILFPTANQDHTEAAFGVWGQAGIYWELGRHFNLGFEANYSWSSILIANIEANAGGLHFGMVLGFHY